MIQIRGLGIIQDPPQVAQDIVSGNTDALQRQRDLGWNIDEMIELDDRYYELPINLALRAEQDQTVHWFVNQGAQLNNCLHSAFLAAVRFSTNHSLILNLVSQGADINKTTSVGADAFLVALHGRKLANLDLIHNLGHTAFNYGGPAFRTAVADGNLIACNFFLAHGVDVNYNKSDGSCFERDSPLCLAPDLKMAKFLIKHGADVLQANDDGMYPYDVAREKGDWELAQYFKSLEQLHVRNSSRKSKRKTHYF
jgi:ankyrin repeat protein